MHGMLVRTLSEKQSPQACFRAEVPQQLSESIRLTCFIWGIELERSLVV